jgi:hypothetical protein
MLGATKHAGWCHTVQQSCTYDADGNVVGLLGIRAPFSTVLGLLCCAPHMLRVHWVTYIVFGMYLRGPAPCRIVCWSIACFCCLLPQMRSAL